MSYSRWSNSAWYSFYNVNGRLSLWYNMDKTIDIDYEDCKTITAEQIQEVYGCTEEEAKEAMTYVGYYLEDYNPNVAEEYNKELADLMKRLNDLQ